MSAAGNFSDIPVAAGGPSRALRTATVLAALSVVLGVAGVITTVTLLDGDRVLPVTLTLLGQAGAAAATTLLLRDARPGARLAPWVFLAALLVAVGALQVFAATAAAGSDAADAGTPPPAFTSIGIPAIALAYVALGTAITALVLALDSRTGGSRVRAAGFGFFAAVPVLIFLFGPLQSIVIPITVGAALLLRIWRTSARRTAPAPPSDTNRRAARRIRPLAAGALALVVVVWGAGIWVGVAGTGTGGATAAMGYAGAASQLAAVPLFLAVAAILKSTGRARVVTTPAALGLATAGMLAGTVIALAAYSPDGVALFAGGAVSGLSLGLWFAATCVPLLPSRFERTAIGVGAVAAGLVAWFAVVSLTGGVAVAVLAIVLLAVGPRLAGIRRGRAAASR